MRATALVLAKAIVGGHGQPVLKPMEVCVPECMHRLDRL
jgi:hypothetical protein